MNTGMTRHEPEWGTADGKRIPFSKVTHQHWSNIYWYHLIFQNKPGMPVRLMQGVVNLAQNEINKHFNGEILEWRPKFDYEIIWLEKLGMLTGGTAIKDRTGKKIGNILTGPITIVPGVV